MPIVNGKRIEVVLNPLIEVAIYIYINGKSRIMLEIVLLNQHQEYSCPTTRYVTHKCDDIVCPDRNIKE